ncbi:MAG: hypothetical protein GWP14_06285 [Actinobacteria bacterium]|nr:hypothetical protein [Actinomycetota bacterium]
MPEQTVGLYIKADFFSRIPKEEIVIFFQILRIINSLEFWLRLHLVIEKEQNNLFEFRNRIELYFAMIGAYKESSKEFCNNLATGLLDMKLSEPVSQKITEYKAWLDNWKQDEYLQVVDRIRNCLRFHMDSRIYDKYITDGKNETKDRLIAVAFGDRAGDLLFTEPYTFEFSYIAEIVPVAADEDKIDWILKRSVEEADRFVKLLKEVVQEVLKGNAYKKSINS